jgi:radical SAM superfamily enzyme YgiQ (UPF0313 family)
MGQRRRVVLYNPRAVFWTMPLGLIAIGSAIDRERYDVRVVDGRLFADQAAAIEAVRSALDEPGANPLCLGMGVLTGAPIRDALAITRAIASSHPELPIVWGGWHPSLFPTQTLRDEPAIRAVVSGQGELTFGELLDRLAGGQELQLVPGVTFRDRDGAVVANLPRPTGDVNQLPRHDYGLIDVEAFYRAKGWRQLDYISSVGCRFRCAFCADPAVYNRSWFGLAAERMGAELSDLYARHPFDEVAFQDETFFTRRERVEDIARVLIGAGLGVAWTGTMRADQGFRLPDETLELCRRSGLRRVMVGVEAGTDEQLARIRKDITIAQVYDTAAKLVRHDVGAIWNFIVGFPDEPEDSFRATLDVARTLRTMSDDFEAAVFFYKPYPGNELAELVGARGFPIPTDLAGWADFDYVGSAGPWVTPDRIRRAERFRFYQRYAFGRHAHPLARPMRALARWRVERGAYGLPIEKLLVEHLRPGPRLS